MSSMLERALGVRQAIEILQGPANVSDLYVDFSKEAGAIGVEEEDETMIRVWLDRFASALEQNGQIQNLWLCRGVFLDPRIDAFVRRLFGSVLPRHQSLTQILLYYCQFLPSYVELFTESLISTAAVDDSNSEHRLFWQSLYLGETRLDHQGSIAISRILQANVPLEKLWIKNASIPSSGCQAILEALDGNTHLRSLSLFFHNNNNNIFLSDVTWKGVRALGNSNLKRLTLHGHGLTREGTRLLAEGLRINFSLEDLRLSCPGSEEVLSSSSDLFEELLNVFNFTLCELRINDDYTHPCQERVDHLLRLNVGVRNAHNNLQSRLNYRMSSPLQHVLWPQTLSSISSKPSLVYRFLRRENLDALTHQVTVTAHHQHTNASALAINDD